MANKAKKVSRIVIKMRDGSRYILYGTGNDKFCAVTGSQIFRGYHDQELTQKTELIVDTKDILVRHRVELML